MFHYIMAETCRTHLILFTIRAAMSSDVKLKYPTRNIIYVSFGAAAQRGLWPPHARGF